MMVSIELALVKTIDMPKGYIDAMHQHTWHQVIFPLKGLLQTQTELSTPCAAHISLFCTCPVFPTWIYRIESPCVCYVAAVIPTVDTAGGCYLFFFHFYGAPIRGGGGRNWWRYEGVAPSCAIWNIEMAPDILNIHFLESGGNWYLEFPRWARI